jgi:hypothetical protein
MDSGVSIELKQLGYNLSIDFTYLPEVTTNSGYGIGRTCSANTYVVSNVGGSDVQIVKGDGNVFTYEKTGTVYSSAPFAYSPNTLTFDGTTFRETAANGAQMVYSSHTSVSWNATLNLDTHQDRSFFLSHSSNSSGLM